MPQQRGLIAAVILPDRPISPLAASYCNPDSGYAESITDYKKALSHIYALAITRNNNTLHFFWWQTKISKCSQPWLHSILDELKVLKREEQILIGSDSISFGFLSLVLSYFLRLSISNLSALPAMDWLSYTIEVLLQSALQPHLTCLGDCSHRLQKIEERDSFEMCMCKEKCIIFHWIQANRLTKLFLIYHWKSNKGDCCGKKSRSVQWLSCWFESASPLMANLFHGSYMNPLYPCSVLELCEYTVCKHCLFL